MGSKELIRSGITMADIGAAIAIISFVLTQFVDITVFHVGMIPITIQKLVAAYFLPLSAVLIGHIRLKLSLIIVATSLLVAYLAAHVVSGTLPPEALSAAASVVFGFWGAVILYTALTQNERNIELLAKVWIIFSVITSIVTVLQALGKVPLMTVPGDYLDRRIALGGLYRGVGLKFDPNFQALMLVIGLVFTQYFTRSGQLYITVVILLGIVATFSRMGLLLGVMIVLFTPFLKILLQRQSFGKALLRLFTNAVIISLGTIIVYMFGPQEIPEYLLQRVQDIAVAITTIGSDHASIGGGHLTSAETRLIVANTAWRLALENWTFGVGAYRSDSAIFAASGIMNVAHNTYLELFLIGGVWGIVAMLCYATILFSGLLSDIRSLAPAFEQGFFFTLVVVFASLCFFLSLTYNSIIWLPLVLSLTILHFEKKRRITYPFTVTRNGCTE